MKTLQKIASLVFLISIISCTDEFDEHGAFITVSESFYAEIAGGGEDSAVVILETTAIPEEDGSIEIKVSDTAGVYTNPAFNDQGKISLQVAKGTTNASFVVKYLKDDVLEEKDIVFTIARVSGGVVGIAKKKFIVRVLPAAGSEFFEDFANDLGDFTSFSVTGDEEWEHASFLDGSAVMSGYSGGSNANDDWLFTPKLNLSSSSAATLEFIHAINVYSASLDDIYLYVSNDYSGSGDPNSATWEEITGWEKGDGGSFDEVESGVISLDEYLGDTAVYVAFRYVSTDAATATWEIGSVTIRGARVGGTGNGGGDGSNNGDAVTTIDEDFNSLNDYDEVQLEGWLNAATDGDRTWLAREFSNDVYAQASGFNSGLSAMTTWLITPAISMEEAKVLSFRTAKAYWEHGSQTPFEVLVSTDFSGESDQIENATWTAISATIAGQSDADHAWVESGEIDLSGYSSDIYIAFKYVGSETQSTTIRIDDIYVGLKEDNNGGGTSTGDPVDSISQDFSSLNDYDEVKIDGWLNVASDGDRTWLAREFDADVYAQASGYNSGLSSMTTWLITPAVKMDKAKVLSFRTAKAYWEHGTATPFEVLVSIDFSGKSEEIGDATWTNLNATIAGQSDADHAWVESGEIDLSAYSSNIFIAFRYTGSETQSTTLRIDDIYVGEGNGNGGVGNGDNETVLLEEDFENFSDRDEVVIEGWSNVASEGSRTWQARAFDGNLYAQATAYSSGESSNVSWLVTESVNLNTTTEEILTFKTKDGYDDGATLNVLVSSNFSGDVTAATWTELSATISTGNTNGYASGFLDSGDVDLSSFSGTIHVAFRYTGGDPGATTTFQLDDIKITGVE